MKKILLLLLPLFVYANCVGKSFNNVAPTVPYHTIEVCYEQYGVLYSNDFNIPLASYEKLTKDSVTASEAIPRKDAFHAEPKYSQVKPSDYRNSGYDKGHMSPADDMPTTNAQYESFSMLNMVPQKHGNNAGLWKQLEEQCRSNALNGNDVYVVSGAIITGTESKLKNITIPVLLYKAVKINQDIKVYVIENIDKPSLTIYKNSDFISKYKINPFGLN